MTVLEKMLQILSDGKPHPRSELFDCMEDALGETSTIRVHLCRLRKQLEPKHETISRIQFNGQVYYQHVRLMASPYR